MCASVHRSKQIAKWPKTKGSRPKKNKGSRQKKGKASKKKEGIKKREGIKKTKKNINEHLAADFVGS